MTSEELREIEQRCEAASEGPWRYEVDEKPGVVTWEHVRGPRPFALHQSTNHPQDSRDLAFIAHARTDVPRLVAEVRRLQAELEGREQWGIDHGLREAAVLLERAAESQEAAKVAPAQKGEHARYTWARNALLGVRAQVLALIRPR